MPKVIYIRHGESVRNVEKVFAGGKDNTPLTANGKKQAKNAGRLLKSENITKIFSSPLSRTIETATIIAGEVGFDVSQIQTDARLIEYDIGAGNGKSMEGMTAAQMVSFDEAEDPQKFKERIVAILSELNSYANDEVILVVAHGGVGRMIECIRLKRDPAEFYDVPGYPNAEPVILDLSWL